jgi:hypothetical protein
MLDEVFSEFAPILKEVSARRGPLGEDFGVFGGFPLNTPYTTGFGLNFCRFDYPEVTFLLRIEPLPRFGLFTC